MPSSFSINKQYSKIYSLKVFTKLGGNLSVCAERHRNCCYKAGLPQKCTLMAKATLASMISKLGAESLEIRALGMGAIKSDMDNKEKGSSGS